MIPVTLYRIDPTKNCHRWYHLDIQPDLFGHSSQVRIIPYLTADEVQIAFHSSG